MINNNKVTLGEQVVTRVMPAAAVMAPSLAPESADVTFLRDNCQRPGAGNIVC